MAEISYSLRRNAADFNKLLNKLKKLEEAGHDVENMMRVNAQNTLNDMQRDAPKDTRNLVNNIEAFYGKDEVIFQSEAIDPNTGIDYAPIQEFGGTDIKYTPYFYKNIRRFRRNLAQSISRRIKNIASRKL